MMANVRRRSTASVKVVGVGVDTASQDCHAGGGPARPGIRTMAVGEVCHRAWQGRDCIDNDKDTVMKTKKKTLQHKVSGITDDKRREAATKEARRRWEDMREVLADRADALGEVAEERWDHARGTAGPQVQKIRDKAAEALDGDVDVDRLRADVAAVSTQAGHNLVKVGQDLKATTKSEADRIITAVRESSAPAQAKQRRRRRRGLIGWTLLGMVVGAALAIRFGPKGRDAVDPAQADAILHSVTDDPATPVAESESENTDSDRTDPADPKGPSHDS